MPTKHGIPLLRHYVQHVRPRRTVSDLAGQCSCTEQSLSQIRR